MDPIAGEVSFVQARDFGFDGPRETLAIFGVEPKRSKSLVASHPFPPFTLALQAFGNDGFGNQNLAELLASAARDRDRRARPIR